MNISSVVVQTVPKFLDEVVESLKNSDACDYHMHDEKGRIIITIEGDNVSEELKKMKVIEQALLQINKIVEGLLGFSRKSESSLETTTSEQIIEDTLVIAEHSLARYSNVKIERKFTPDLPQIHVDKRQVQQVFLNFMMNAAQAMPEGGTLTIMNRMVADKNNPSKKFVETIFRDTGIGIPKEKFEKLFQPFYTEGKKGGTGLGLSISKSIIEKHGGCIYLDSKVGVGTTFFIRLPAL